MTQTLVQTSSARTNNDMLIQTIGNIQIRVGGDGANLVRVGDGQALQKVGGQADGVTAANALIARGVV